MFVIPKAAVYYCCNCLDDCFYTAVIDDLNLCDLSTEEPVAADSEIDLNFFVLVSRA